MRFARVHYSWGSTRTSVGSSTRRISALAAYPSARAHRRGLSGRLAQALRAVSRSHAPRRADLRRHHPARQDLGLARCHARPWSERLRLLAYRRTDGGALPRHGHLPFSHAAEEELLPEGVVHERITWDIVHLPSYGLNFDGITPPVRPDDVGKLAVGPRKAELRHLRVVSSLGRDPRRGHRGRVVWSHRMDYLLRDSLHTGVQARPLRR